VFTYEYYLNNLLSDIHDKVSLSNEATTPLRF